MKNCYIPALILIIVFNSCSVNKAALVQRNQDIQNAKTAVLDCFVELNDGTTQHYASLELVKGLFITPYLLANGTVKVDAKNVRSYQNAAHYAISQEIFNPKRKSHVAVESLPGFAVRIAKGRLNIYVRKTYNTQKAVDEFFIQSGTDGQIIAYSYTAMKDFIKNNPQASEYFNKIKSPTSEKLKTTAEIYNNALSITRSR